MSRSEIAKLVVAVILGIITAHFWSNGETTIAIFLIATTVFHLFFVTAEKQKEGRIDIRSDSKFAKEMREYKKKSLFKN